MKIFSFIILAILFSGFSLLADDYAHVDEVTMSSSFNDFNAVKAAVKMTIGDAQIKGEGDYVVYYWDGDSWEDPYEDNFWNPPLPIWGTIQYDDDVYIVGIADNGNGSFRVIFRATADQAMHNSGYSNFSVTDVVAPAAPANLTISSNPSNHPVLNWNANQEADLNNYLIYRNVIWDRYNQTGWEYKGSASQTNWTDSNFLIGEMIATAYYKIKARDMNNNNSPYSNTVSVEGAPGIGKNGNPYAQNNDNAPKSYFLSDNYPNPFNPSTKISFSLPSAEFVSLNVYDINGKLISNLVNENKEAGNYTVEFNGQSLPSGLYFYKIKAGKFSSIERMLLVK